MMLKLKTKQSNDDQSRDALIDDDPLSSADALYRIKVLESLIPRHYKLIRGLAYIAVMSVTIAAIAVFYQPKPLYFYVDSLGNTLVASPLDKPFNTESARRTWVESIVRDAYTLSFLTFDDDVNLLRDRMTKQTFDAWKAGVKKQGLLKDFVKSRIIMMASVDPAILKESKIIGGRYTEIYNVTSKVTMYRGADSKRYTYTVRGVVWITRVDTRKRKEGFVVTKFLMKQ